jgi:hypothetical protein
MYGARELKDVAPLVLVDHFVLGVLEKIVELPKKSPVFAKQQLQHSLRRLNVHTALVLILLN